MTALSSTPTIHSFGHLAGRIAQASAPRDRGPDRRVRAGCIDEAEPAAQPWDRNRFSSSAERISTTESLVAVTKELEAEHRAAFPRGALKELQDDQQRLRAEAAELAALPADQRPIGRPAAIRIELERIAAALEQHSLGITRADVRVYEAIFDFLCFAGSGQWFPSWAAIAVAANCCEKTVGRALKRFKHHGLLAWKSRSTMKSRRCDPAAKQRVQTSHAYFLDLKKRMAERVYQRFVQLRDRRLKRFGLAKPPAAPRHAIAAPPNRDVADQRRAVASLGAALSGPDGHLG
ncbi:hypothetical protein NF701_02375 [Sphingomonadaceae bacterium OTU29THOMA1]|nr:hypothetical protein NF701_02375 [Sphingomonadaceae bacterium OTU29THOMA1]